MTASTRTYEYGGDLQERILAFVLKDPRLAASRREVLRPEFFEDKTLSTIARLGLQYYDRHQDMPSRAMMRTIIGEWAREVSYPDEMRAALALRCEKLYDLPVQDESGLTERIVKFAQRQALRQAMDEMVGLLRKDDDLGKARAALERALMVGHGAARTGVSVMDGLDTLPERAREVESRRVKIPTLFPTLDKESCPRQGERWLAIALPGGGKSSFLTNIAANAVRQGFSVAHATLGDLHEEDQEVRAAARLTKLPQSEILAGSDAYYQQINKLNRQKASWHIKYWPSEAATVGDIRAWLMHLTTVLGIHIDVLVLDYIGELKQTDNSYAGTGSDFSLLGQLADDFSVLIWTGAQVQRRGADLGEEDVLQMAHIAESWKSAFKVDGCVTWNQTATEYAAGRGRLWVDKVRRGPSKVLIPLDVDFSRALFTER